MREQYKAHISYKIIYRRYYREKYLRTVLPYRAKYEIHKKRYNWQVSRENG